MNDDHHPFSLRSGPRDGNARTGCHAKAITRWRCHTGFIPPWVFEACGVAAWCVVVRSSLLLAILLGLACPSADAGTYVEGVTTNHSPMHLTIDRSDGAHNVLSWYAPSPPTGTTTVAYKVFRTQGDGMFAPTQLYTLPATASTYTDNTDAYYRSSLYYVRAIFEDAAGLRTESIPSAPALAYDAVVGPEPWACQPLEVDWAPETPVPKNGIGCTVADWT